MIRVLVIVLLVLLLWPVWFREEYPVTYTGQWSWLDKMQAERAVRVVGQRFSDLYDLPPGQAFEYALGQVTFRSVPYDGWYATAHGQEILFRKGRVSVSLVIHELGHTFNYRYHNTLIQPTRLLIWEGVYARDGQFVTGNRYGSYDRHGGQRAPHNGYWSDNYRAGYQLHPRGLSPYGNSASEDFADIFLNWTRRSFVPNDAGRALHRWMDRNMKKWLPQVVLDPAITYYLEE